MRKSLKFLVVFFSLLVIINEEVISQCSTLVMPGNGSTSGNARAPSPRFRWARSAYLISPAEMAASGFASGSTVSGIGWNYTVGSSSATGTLIIYLQNTSDVSYLKGTDWNTIPAGMTMVSNSSYTIPGTIGNWDVTFSGGSPFTYTGGGVYVAFDWQNCVNPVSATAPTILCSNITVGGTNGLVTAQPVAPGSCPALTAAGASAFRPDTRFIAPSPANDISVNQIFTLGSLPLGYTTNHLIQAMVSNKGNALQTNVNVTLSITGANTFTSTKTVALLAACTGTATVTFEPFTPSAAGTNTITVSVTPDANTANDSKTMTQNITSNSFSYRYPPSLVNDGGVGFTGGTGAFVGEFNTASGIQINEVQVDFTTSGNPYRLGIYGDNGAGRPGALLYTDAADRISALGTAFLTLPSPVNVPAGNFYVGIRQTGTVNIGFAFSTESPIRQGSFYYTSPLPEPGTWIDLNAAESGVTTLTYRFNITVNLYIPSPPNCVVNMQPANATTACPTGQVLSWVSGGGGPTGYDVYLSTVQTDVTNLSSSARVSANQPGLTYNTGALTPGSTYYWTVVAKNADGDATGCAVQSFSVGDIYTCYCVPTHPQGCGLGNITEVEMNTLDNITTCNPPAYEMFPQSGSTTTSVMIGTQSTLAVTTDDICIVSVWVDWNQNQVFEVSEWQQVTLSSTIGVPSTVLLSVPSNAVAGTTLMRIRSRFATNPNGSSDACTAFGSGETEDYKITVSAPNVTFTGLDADYCVDASAVLLTPAQSGGTFSGPGVIPFGSDYYFDPSSASVGGPYTITYTIGLYSSSQTTTVHDLPSVTLAPQPAVCSIDTPFALIGGNPTGGTYFGDGVTNNIFDPVTAGLGDHTITYVYTDQFGCSSFDQKIITVNAATQWYADSDLDTYGNSSVSVMACSQPNGYVSNNTDCNDSQPLVHPDQSDLCNDIDDDCDLAIDEDATFVTYYTDGDNDGYGASNDPGTSLCSNPGTGYATNNGDCNDSQPLVHPNQSDLCNSIDDDCDTGIDEDATFVVYYPDTDNDGYGASNDPGTSLCSNPGTGYATSNGDCNDSQPLVHPDQSDLCNGIDDDCDSGIDEDATFVIYYTDTDNDGYGASSHPESLFCSNPGSGYSTNNDDCNDLQASVHPGAVDACDFVDNNCDGVVDENAISATVTPGGTATFCHSVPVTLSVNTDEGVFYQWNKGGNPIAGETNSTFITTKKGNYSVFKTNGICAVNSDFTTVARNPVPPASVIVLGDLDLCNTGSVEIRANGGINSPYTYQWLKGGIPQAGLTSRNITVTGAGDYSVAVTNTYNCSKTSASVTVYSSCREEESLSITAGILTLYPNPATDHFMVEMKFGSNVSAIADIQILNLFGQVIYSNRTMVSDGRLQQEISPGKMASGSYFVRVIVDDKAYTGQIIYQK